MTDTADSYPADGHSIIEKTYIVEFKGRRFSIGAGDLAARLSNVKLDEGGIERELGKGFNRKSFSLTELHGDKTRIVAPIDFGPENQHYYHLTALLAKRGALKEFEQPATTIR